MMEVNDDLDMVIGTGRNRVDQKRMHPAGLFSTRWIYLHPSCKIARQYYKKSVKLIKLAFLPILT